jgi:hypothetical protein
MRRLRFAVTSWSIAGALLAIARCLRAQQATPAVAAQRGAETPTGAVRVVVTTDDDALLLTIAEPGKRNAIVSCHHQCSFWGVPGRYTLRATSTDGQTDCQTTLQVGPHAVFTVSVGHNTGMRTAGLIAGIAGPIAMASGFYFGLSYALDHQCDDSLHCPSAPDAFGDLALAGLASTIIGWAVFGFAPRELHVHAVDVADVVDNRPARPAPKHSWRPKLGAVPLPGGGWGAGLSMVF